MKDLEKLTLFDSATGDTVTILVTTEVYNEYMRSIWRTHKQDDKYNSLFTPFSALIGGENGAYENFHEFVNEDDLPEKELEKKLKKEIGYRALESLPKTTRKRFVLFYFHRLKAKEIAEIEGVSVNSIQSSLAYARRSLKKFLKNFQK